MTYSEFLEKIIKSKVGTTVIVKGEPCYIKGITKLSSKNYRQELGFYYKVIFTNNQMLCLIPKLQQIQYASEGNLGAIPGIPDQEVRTLTSLSYQGRSYKVVNSSDYQYTLELICGEFEDVEEECFFSDFVCESDPTDSVSLGIITSTGLRADYHLQELPLENVKF